MSRLYKSQAKNDHRACVEEISALMKDSGALYANRDIGAQVPGLESLDASSFNQVKESAESLKAALMQTATFGGLIAKVAEVRGQHLADVALESAVLTILASGDAAAWHNSFENEPSAPKGEFGVLVNPATSGVDFAGYGLEGFDPASMDEWAAQSAYVNAIASIQSQFEEAFFPIQVVPAGQEGVDVEVSVPRIWGVKQRNSDGTPAKFTKTRIIQALIDSSILDNNSTTCFPLVVDATNPVQLATAAQVPNKAVVIDGATYQTRPILFGTEADLVVLSHNTTLLAGGVLDESDVLDKVINIGEVAYSVTVSDGTLTETGVFRLDVSNQPGALLQRSAELTDKRYHANLPANLSISNSFSAVAYSGTAGTKLAFDTLVNTALTQVPADAYSVNISALINAVANTEEASYVANANNVVVGGLVDKAGAVVAVPVGYTVTVAPIGSTPKARRSNSNIRTRGTVIDSTHRVTYRFPVPLSAPLMSQSPVNGVSNTTIEGLAMTERVRNNNNAHTTLFAMRDVLATNSGLPLNSSAMGGEFIDAAYVYEQLDVYETVATLSSKDSLDDLRGAFQAALITAVNKLIQKSGYLAALEFVQGVNTGYEVIVVTDDKIYPWLMESGDSRFLGNNVKYTITQSLNKQMRGKILFSFRRAQRDGKMNPMDFGAFLYTPSLTYEVQTTRGGAIRQELHNVPRNAHYVTLPVLGEIDVLNLDTLYFTDEAITP